MTLIVLLPQSNWENTKAGFCVVCSVCLTSDTSFPDNIGVSEARDDVVGDSEGESQAVFASFLECEEALLWRDSEWNWQNQVWPSWA